jgi:hypothetical protein
MFRQGSILGSTYFASREPVRSPLALRLVDTGRRLASKDTSMAGSMSHRLPRGMLVTSDAAFPTMAEDSIVELMDYDPVRKTSIVVGLKEPTIYVPHHWLALRTHPEANVSCLLLMESPPKGVKVFSTRLLRGSFEEAMEMVKALKGCRDGCLFMEGRGLFIVTKDLRSLERTVSGLRPKGPGKGTKPKGKGKASATKVTRTKAKRGKKAGTPKSKRTTGKKRTHYKRGPTRRGSGGRKKHKK